MPPKNEVEELIQAKERFYDRYQRSSLAVAEGLILGEINEWELHLAEMIVTPLILETARIRLQAMGKLTAKHIKPAISDDPDFSGHVD